MNILYLDQFSDMGGAQCCWLDLLPAMQERGWQILAALPGNGSLVERLRARGFRVHRIPCGPYHSGGKNGADFLRFVWDVKCQVRIIADLLARSKFDLIYVNGPRLLPAAALAAGGRVPILFHAHNYIAQRYAARVAGWSIRRSHATVVAYSQLAAGPLRPYTPRERLHVIPNGISDIGFHQKRFDPTGIWRIGMVGRIAPEKGTIEFVRAAAVLSSLVPNARFVICGAPLLSSQRYYDEVRSLAHGLPIEFLGWKEDVARILNNLDLLVIPSKLEGPPRVLLEAFSAGVPVVAFPAGGIVEAVEDEETGFLVPEASSGALASRLHELIAGDPQRLRHVAANSRLCWQRSYTIASFQERIVQLILNLVSTSQTELETAALPAHK